MQSFFIYNFKKPYIIRKKSQKQKKTLYKLKYYAIIYLLDEWQNPLVYFVLWRDKWKLKTK